MSAKQKTSPEERRQAQAIQADSLTKSYASRQALNSVSFTLPRGGFLSIFGPNGAGKSTLLRLLSSLARPSSGSAQVLGFDLTEEADELRQQIGVISHRSMLYPDLTAQENLMYYARLYGVQQPNARVNELLELVELTARRHDVIRGFSRGMTQRIAIARALINDPELLFLDEPYSGLDPRAVDILDQLIEQIRPERSFLMVSHDLSHGYQLASHLMILDQGRLAYFAERHESDAQDFAQLYRQTVGVALA